MARATRWHEQRARLPAMDKQPTWDFALRLKGVSPRKLPMSRLAEYLKEWAELIGPQNQPIFRGVKQGSTVLLAKVDGLQRTETRIRLLDAKARPDAGAAKYISNLKRMVGQDHVHGQIEDSKGKVLIELDAPPLVPSDEQEYIVPDSGTLDGTVVGVAGIDDTVHIRIQEESGATWSVELRDLEMARKFAKRFRADPIRVIVHGTWKRTSGGVWEPHNLVADGFEELEPGNALEVLNGFRAIPRNGWSELEDPQSTWRDLRGSE